MVHSDIDRALALAGIYQAAVLVDQTAHGRSIDNDALDAIIGSVLSIDAPDVPSVYGGPAGVALGLRTLVGHLDNRGSRKPAISRYVIALLHLERRMHKQAGMADKIGSGIQATQRQAVHFNDNTHPAVLGALANVYEETFSTLKFRIQVNGEQPILAVPDTVNKVRALLLAGVRSAVLYRQCGGRTWTLVLSRRKIQQTATQLLADIDDT